MKRHDSMRGWLAHEMWQQIKKNDKIILIVGDMGYKVWDSVRKDRPKQFLNVGAAEQSMLDIAVGLALSSKIPVVYTITPFLLYRPFETIRTYIDYEKIPVKLIGSGRDKDYSEDGHSHHSEDDDLLFKPQIAEFDDGIERMLPNIKARWPCSEREIPALVKEMLYDNNPWYINLKR